MPASPGMTARAKAMNRPRKTAGPPYFSRSDSVYRTAEFPWSGRWEVSQGPAFLPTSKPTESPVMAHTTTTTITTPRLTLPSPANTPPITTAVSPGMKKPTIRAASANARNPMRA